MAETVSDQSYGENNDKKNEWGGARNRTRSQTVSESVSLVLGNA